MNSWRCVLGTYFTKVINDTLCFAANPQLLKGCGARPHLTQNVSGRSGVILLRIEDAGRTGGTDPPPAPPAPAPGAAARRRGPHLRAHLGVGVALQDVSHHGGVPLLHSPVQSSFIVLRNRKNRQSLCRRHNVRNCCLQTLSTVISISAMEHWEPEQQPARWGAALTLS